MYHGIIMLPQMKIELTCSTSTSIQYSLIELSLYIPSVSDLPTLNSTITSVVISVSEVYDILSSLNTSKAMGLDGIGCVPCSFM